MVVIHALGCPQGQPSAFEDVFVEQPNCNAARLAIDAGVLPRFGLARTLDPANDPLRPGSALVSQSNWHLVRA